MVKVGVSLSRANDGTFSAYCDDYPALFGMGDTRESAVEELKETLRITKEELGKESALFYPQWLDEEYEFNVRWDLQDMLEYYAGIITPTALGRLSGMHPKQIWSYMHGKTHPRKAQADKITSALHRLGQELLDISF